MSKEVIELKAIEAQCKDAEEALEESENKYKFLVDNSKEIILILDKNAKIIFANNSALANFGYSQNDLIGKPITRFLTSDCIKKTLYALFQEFFGHPQPEFEVRAKTKSGELRYLRVAQGSVPVHEKGKLIGLMVCASDVTDHYKAGEELQASEKRFKELWDDAPVAYHILDAKGILIDANQTETKMLGYAKEEMVGKSIFAFILPAQRAEAQRRFQRKILGQSISRAEDRIYVKKDGSEIHVDIDDVVERDKNGQIIGIRSTMLDVTGRKLAEQKLGESEKRYDDLFDNVPIGLYRTTPSGEWLDVNLHMAKMLGYPTRDAMLKTNVAENYLNPEDREKWKTILEKDGVLEDFESWLLRPDGRLVWVMDSARAIKDKEGQISSFEGGIVDVTARKYAEEALHFEREQLLSIFNSIDENIYVSDPATYKILYVNDALVRAFQKNPIGGICYQEFQGLDHPCEFCTNEIILKDKGKPYRWEFHNPILKRDFHLVDRIIEWPDGRDVKFEMAIDITERKKAEESVTRLFSAAELSPDSIVVADLQGWIVDVNAITLEKYSATGKSELIGTNFFELIAPEDRERAIGEMAEVLGRGKLENREYKIIDKRGNLIPIEMSAAVMRDKEGKATGFVGVCRDVTERQLSQAMLHRSMAQLQRTLKAAIKSLSSAIEMRDPYTVGHQERVAMLTTAIAQEMGLLPEQIEGLQVASIIHDVGKLNVPSEILSKPTRLTDMEYGLIKTHPEAGFKLLRNIEFPWPVAEIVYQHHECMNGSGYPRGLTGKDILLEARILRVADVVEAMSSHRPYRPALGIEIALQEITARKGTLYDPEVVDACLKVFRSGYSFSAE